MLTKLDNSRILLNIDSIKYIESVPDTLIWFINGESVIVKERVDEIQQQVINLRADILHRAQCRKD